MFACPFLTRTKPTVLPQEKQRMTDKLEDTSLRLRDEMDLYKKMMDKLRQNRQQFQKEKEAMQEVGGAILHMHGVGRWLRRLVHLQNTGPA